METYWKINGVFSNPDPDGGYDFMYMVQWCFRVNKEDLKFSEASGTYVFNTPAKQFADMTDDDVVLKMNEDGFDSAAVEAQVLSWV